MRATLKRLFILGLTLLLLAVSALPCFASAQSGKITVLLEDQEKKAVNGLTVHACRIAELNNSGYSPAKAFENSGISIAGIINNPNETAAKTVAAYIQDHHIDKQSVASENGKATFTDLPLGIWLIFPEEESTFTFNPYFVFLPYEAGGVLCYEVPSAPKLEDNNPNKINIYVLKKWDDKNNASKKRPQAVTVELLNGNAVAASIELSEKNGWAHTFSNLPKDGNYSIREKAVANYKADYSGDYLNGFVVTNTYAGEKLPQTGQYWWPILLIAIAGACFILLGVYEIGVKKNGEKK